MSAAISQPVEALRPKVWVLWVGRAISALAVLVLVASATMKLTHAPNFVAVFVGHLGYPEHSLTAIGLLEITCALLYAVPRTAILGAVLLTGYLGGAVATHVRIGDPFLVPVALGALVWLGLYLREPRVRALAPTVARPGGTVDRP